MAIRVGLVGYGAGGRFFHAPYIQASEACELVGVVTRSARRAALATEDIPGLVVYASLTELLDAGVDAVVISTPPETRRELVLSALARCVHVVADKPFAPSAAAGQALVEAADAAGVLLNVFHNRRWDTDVVTARAVLASGELGSVTRLDLRFDLDDQGTLEAGPGGGLLRDLGTHVGDQALWLLGPARRVSALIDWIELPEGRTASGFVLAIEHASGAHSHVSASKLNRLISRELRLHGTGGSYVSSYDDVQTRDMFAGLRPAQARATWGYEAPERWGTLRTSAGARPIPSAQGDYTRFYDEFAAAILTGGRGPVPAVEGVAVLRLLDAALTSAEEHRVVEL